MDTLIQGVQGVGNQLGQLNQKTEQQTDAIIAGFDATGQAIYKQTNSMNSQFNRMNQNFANTNQQLSNIDYTLMEQSNIVRLGFQFPVFISGYT